MLAIVTFGGATKGVSELVAGLRIFGGLIGGAVLSLLVIKRLQ